MPYPAKRKYNLTEFFGNFFANFGRLMIVNILFSIPLAAFVGVLFLIGSQGGGVSFLLVFMLIPLMSPFFAGLTNVCRKLTSVGKVRPIKDFFSGIASNWLFFLVNSVFLYIFSMSVWASAQFFRGMEMSIELVAYLITIILTAILFIFVELSAVVMAVSVELKFTEIIKNSFVLVIKGITNHLKTLFSLMFALTLVYSLVLLVREPIALSIIFGVLMVTVLPAFLMYIIVYNSYQTVEKLVILPFSKEQKQAAESALEKAADEALTIEDLEPLAKGDPEEYVFLNGKTVKRKTILKMIEVRKNSAKINEAADI